MNAEYIRDALFIEVLEDEDVINAEQSLEEECRSGYVRSIDGGDCIELSKDENDDSDDELDAYIGNLADYIQLYAIRTSGEKEIIQWSLIEVSETAILIKLVFDQDFSITSDAQVELLISDFSRIDGGFPALLEETTDLSNLIVKEDSSAPVNEITSAATNVLLVSTVTQIVSRGSLAQLWGVINGL